MLRRARFDFPSFQDVLDYAGIESKKRAMF